MQFDTALNVAWLLLGVLAFASTASATFSGRTVRTRKSRWLHIIGVGMIVTALFPYISATDDVLRIEHFNAQHSPGHSNKQSQNDDLLRLYEVIDTAVVCQVAQVALVLLFISVIFTPVARLIERSTPMYAGRSPPLAI